VGFVDDVRQYGKVAAGHASGAGLGLDSYEQDEVRRKEPADHAGKADLDDRRTIGLHRPRGEEDLAKDI
jgi:hypothetical protein